MPLAEVVPEATSSVVPVVVDAPVLSSGRGTTSRGDLDAGGLRGRVRQRPGGVAGVVPVPARRVRDVERADRDDPGRRGGDPGRGRVRLGGRSGVLAVLGDAEAEAGDRRSEVGRARRRTVGRALGPRVGLAGRQPGVREREPRQTEVDGCGVTTGRTGPGRRRRCGGRRQRCAGQKTDGHGEDQEGGEQPAHAKPSVVSDPASRDAGHLPRESRTVTPAGDLARDG